MWKCNLSGLLNQHRWIPLYALGGSQGLVVNFYLAPVNDALIHTNGGHTYSQGYVLTDVKAMCQMNTISDELMESFQGQLLNGSALRLPIRKVESLWSYIPNNVPKNFSVPMSRAYTRLCTLWASFAQEPPADGSGKAKLCNTFYVDTSSAETLAYSLQLGTRRIPDNDAVGFSEHFSDF